jgi:RNA polymerase sigma-70 factor (ECF subfamily)
MKVNEDDHSARDPSLGDGADDRRIRAYLDGDGAAADEIESWIRKDIAVRYPILRPEMDDLCQSIHEKLFEKLKEGRFRHRSSLRSYVAGITHHTAISRIRARYRERDLWRGWESRSAHVAPSAYQSLAELQERQLLHQVVQRSSESCRSLWRMVFIERLSYAEIARRLSIPPGTVKSRMWHCRRRALALLERLRKAASPRRRKGPRISPD